MSRVHRDRSIPPKCFFPYHDVIMYDGMIAFRCEVGTCGSLNGLSRTVDKVSICIIESYFGIKRIRTKLIFLNIFYNKLSLAYICKVTAADERQPTPSCRIINDHVSGWVAWVVCWYISSCLLYLAQWLRSLIRSRRTRQPEVMGSSQFNTRSPGIILSMGSANGRKCYIVTPSLIGWAHTENYLLGVPIKMVNILQITFSNACP